MPEYLAPGVYVEETSFRAKSIEGVGTSTTAFVGPTRKGPLGDTPPLLTSFGEFERLYGGLEDLQFGNDSATNYLAHSVLAYFNEGGARLYVARVDTRPNANVGTARSGLLADLQPPPQAPVGNGRVLVAARQPGSLGNGRVDFVLRGRQVNKATLLAAPEGTLVRTGGSPAQPARLTGTVRGPFRVPNDSRLVLQVNGNEVPLTLHGELLSITAPNDLDPDPAGFAAPNDSLRLTLDGVEQRIPLPTVAAQTRADVVAAINQVLRAGNASLNGNRLVIRSDRLGRSARVVIQPNAALGFNLAVDENGTSIVANTVEDLTAVTAADLDRLLTAANAGVAAATDDDGRILLRTTLTGVNATLHVSLPAGPLVSAHAELGFVLPALGAAPNRGVDGQAVAYYLKQAGAPDNYRTEPTNANPQGLALGLAAIGDQDQVPGGMEVLTLTVIHTDAAGAQSVFQDLAFGEEHPRYVGERLHTHPRTQTEALENPVAVIVNPPMNAYALRRVLEQNARLELTNGSDGGVPTANGYATALSTLESLEDISIVAAPGSASYGEGPAIQTALIAHVDNRAMSRYRMAVLEAPENFTIDEVRGWRSRIDSTRAALYYPWVVVANPLARPGRDDIPRELALPPSGLMCGIYARNDIEKTVSKAPANEIVRSALRFSREINFAQQEMLNPLGVNCLRYFPGRGNRVWGARTASSDPEWKYVNVRRYFNYLEASIDRGTQWAVFENNGERLWANIRETIEDFLYNEWVSGNLLGASPKEAYFVRCDRSTMTQNDLDNGRLICLIGVAALKPAEFVIFRIGQKTADART